MQIKQAMSRDVSVADPKQTIQDAAKIMAQLDIGVLPVGENDKLVGMITDRDIAIRAIAAGKTLSTPIDEVMSHEVMYCFEDDDIAEVTANMADLQVRRLPVVNRQKRLVGIVALADIANADGPGKAGTALSGISQPGGPHSQSDGNAGAKRYA